MSELTTQDGASPVPAPAPLAAFDGTGTASVISYQTPESTSYDGRNVLVLDDYGLSDFADVIAAGQGSGNAGGPGGSPAAALAAPPAATGPVLTDYVAVPRAVVLSDSGSAQDKLIALAPFALSARLASLTWADVQVAAAARKRIEVYRSVGGPLDYRVRDISQASTPVVPQTGSSPGELALPSAAAGSAATMTHAPAEPGVVVPNGGGGGGGPHPYILVEITSPDANNPSFSGPSNGLNLPVRGSIISEGAGPATLGVSLLAPDGGAVAEVGASISGTSWAATLPVTASGAWTVRAAATSVTGVHASISVTIFVTLAPTGGGGPPAPTPSVAITSPARNSVIAAPDGSALVTVTGTADNGGGSAVTVSVSADGGTPVTAAPTPTGGTTISFSASVPVSGEGAHLITATAVNEQGIAAPAITVPVKLAASLPVRPLDRKLLLIEKVAITSFLSDFGAGRLVKTFSLLPGEQTVISVDTYTKDETTAQTAASILDSTATECAADFEDTVNAENDSKASSADATSASIAADVGANWGWGHASIQGKATDSANSSRENMTKTVVGALAKHSSKASSNRTVSVNTEFTSTVSTGTTTDTTRTLKNINVSRVLNFVFRQMTQEHTVFVHMTDAVLGYYKLDLLLDANGNPQTGPGGPVTQETFTEYSLPEIADFAQNEMTTPAAATLQANILKVLSSIPDYTGTQRSLVELVTPKAPDGTPQPAATYLRVRPNLTGSYPAAGKARFTVPGIILGVTTCIMRTDQLLCDALLGEGDALDSYSHALQDVAIAERQAAVAAQDAALAREKLAQSIVSSKDADMAATWQKIFPQPLSVPATVTVPVSANGTGA